MIKRALTASCIAVMAASSIQAAVGERLCGGFYDPAFRYGGRGLLARHGDRARHRLSTWKHDSLRRSIACRQTLSLVPWRTPQEAEALANPPADSLNRDRAGVYYVTWRAASAYRGYNRTFRPTSTFCGGRSGQPQVTSRIGEGFNLDGKIKPNDFVSPDGEKGIDNQLYGLGDAMRHGAALAATARLYCARTTRCSRACTPSLSGSRAIRTR